MDDVAVMVGQHLHFDVPRVLDVFFEIHVAVAEGGLGLGPRLLQRRLERQVVRRHAHAAAAAAGHRLDQHGKADLVGEAQRFLVAGDHALAAGHDGHAGLAGQIAGRVLVAELGHRLRAGADEVDLAAAADLVEVGVLGQEAVAGMNRLHVADFGGADHAGDLEIAVGRLRRADAIRFVGQLEIAGAAIALAEDGHRLDAQLAARPDDPQRDFTAIGNENSLVHGREGQVSGCQVSGVRIRLTDTLTP